MQNEAFQGHLLLMSQNEVLRGRARVRRSGGQLFSYFKAPNLELGCPSPAYLFFQI